MRFRVIWDHFKSVDFTDVAKAHAFAAWVNKTPPANPWNGVARVFVWTEPAGRWPHFVPVV